MTLDSQERSQYRSVVRIDADRDSHPEVKAAEGPPDTTEQPTGRGKAEAQRFSLHARVNCPVGCPVRFGGSPVKTPAEKAAYNAAWRAAHPDYHANYYRVNRERIAARNKAHRQAHLDEYKAREAASRQAHPENHSKWVKKNRAHVTAYKVAWRKAHPEKLKAATKRARRWHPVENRARGILNDAIRDGKMKRGVCVVCGDHRAHGHHTDYSKPLDVIWLCAKDHRRAHRGELAEFTTAKFSGSVPGLSVTVTQWATEED